MTREDIAYLNSWSKAFGKCSVAKMFKALIEGIWISSNKDPEDIYKVHPRLIQTSVGSAAYIDRQFSLCPFEFSFEDSETYEWKNVGNKPDHKGRLIKHYGRTWSLDCYEMRRIVSETGRQYAKKYKIRKEDILELVGKNGFDDAKSYAEYMETRPDLAKPTDSKYVEFTLDEFKFVRAAFAPNVDRMYNWADHPELCGLED